MEDKLKYNRISEPEKSKKAGIVEHISHFVAYLWQIHAFEEGNTRTTAVFDKGISSCSSGKPYVQA